MLSSNKNFAERIVANCLNPGKPSEEVAKDIQENFLYVVDNSKIPNISSLLKGSSTRPSNTWHANLAKGAYFTEVFGQCSKPQQCAAIRFEVWRDDKGVESFSHYMILVRNSSGQFEKKHESFGVGGRKG